MAKYASPESGDLGPWCVGGSHMPSDIVHQIVTFLPERDICSLEICSRFWQALCSSDLVWFHLFRKRWASSAPSHVVSSYLKNPRQESPEKRLCDCALDEPCSYHCLYKLPHEVKTILAVIVQYEILFSHRGHLEQIIYTSFADSFTCLPCRKSCSIDQSFLLEIEIMLSSTDCSVRL